MKELNITYKGLDLIITGYYKKGAGYFHRDDPPEEDEFDILEIGILMSNNHLNMSEFILNKEILNESELEQLCIDKCKE